MEYCECGAPLFDLPLSWSPDGVHCGICYDLLHGSITREQLQEIANQEEEWENEYNGLTEEEIKEGVTWTKKMAKGYHCEAIVDEDERGTLLCNEPAGNQCSVCYKWFCDQDFDHAHVCCHSCVPIRIERDRHG